MAKILNVKSQSLVVNDNEFYYFEIFQNFGHYAIGSLKSTKGYMMYKSTDFSRLQACSCPMRCRLWGILQRAVSFAHQPKDVP